MFLGMMVTLWDVSNNVVLLKTGRKKHASVWWHWLSKSSRGIGTMLHMQGRVCVVVSVGTLLVGWWEATKGTKVGQSVVTTIQLAQEVRSFCCCWLTWTINGLYLQVEGKCLAWVCHMIVVCECGPAWYQRSLYPSEIRQKSGVVVLPRFVDVVVAAKALKMNDYAAGHCKRLWRHQQRSQMMN